MKSAEEWLTDGQDGHSITGRVMRLEDVRAIQADALLRAAEIVSGYDVGYDAKTGEGWRTRKEIGELVLAEADRIEKGNQTK